MVHYLGNEKISIPSAHGNSDKTNKLFFRTKPCINVPSRDDVPSFQKIPRSDVPFFPNISSPISSTQKHSGSIQHRFPQELSPVQSGIEIPSDQDTSYAKDIRNSLEVWVPADGEKLSINLNVDDRKILTSKAWLNDTIIDASMSLLSHQFPEHDGFQSCLCGRNRSFKRHSDLFIQIINRSPTGKGSHWITVSNLKALDLSKDIVVYDSAYEDIPHEQGLVIASLVDIKSDVLNVHFANVQMQRNDYDCGLFAIANATTLASYLD